MTDCGIGRSIVIVSMKNASAQVAQPRKAVVVGAVSDFSHSSPRGIRVPGWEDVSIKKLASALGRNTQHIREILTGRKDCKLTLLHELADKLNVEVGEIVERIRKAEALDEQRMTNELEALRSRLKGKMLARARNR